jgi:hypothetical protein
MERYLLEQELATKSDNRKLPHTDSCPEESWHWDFLDDQVVDPVVSGHVEKCPFCINQLHQVAKALLSVTTDGGQSRVIHAREVTSALPDAKLVLKALGASIVEIFNPFTGSPAYRSASIGPIVVVNVNDKAPLKVELSLEKNGTFQILAEVEKGRSRKSVTVELTNADGVLRSVVMTSGERKLFGSWPKGIYKLIVRASAKSLYEMELDLR